MWSQLQLVHLATQTEMALCSFVQNAVFFECCRCLCAPTADFYLILQCQICCVTVRLHTNTNPNTNDIVVLILKLQHTATTANMLLLYYFIFCQEAELRFTPVTNSLCACT